MHLVSLANENPTGTSHIVSTKKRRPAWAVRGVNGGDLGMQAKDLTTAYKSQYPNAARYTGDLHNEMFAVLDLPVATPVP